MTTELEYSFIDVVPELRIQSELMTRAVRVKQVVRDKVQNLFNKSLASVKKEEPTVTVPVQVEEQPHVQVSEEKEEHGLGSLIDLSDDGLKALNSKLDALENQGKVPATPRRVVLFTNNLISKVKSVTSKWIKKEEKKVELPKVEITNHLGGEVIPGTWDDEVISKEPETSNIEPVTPSVEPNEALVVKAPESLVPVENVVPNIEAPVEEKVEPEIPNFIPNVIEETPSVEPNEAPAVEPVNEVQNVVLPQINENEFVKEPIETQVNETMIPEPVEVQKEEFAPTPVEEINENEYVVEPKDVAEIEKEEARVEEVKEPSIEDRISELLNRKEENKVESDETTKFTQTAILAKLQKVNNMMKKKDSEIKNLRDKNQKLSEDNSSMKAKMSENDATIKDLTSKNNELTSENEKLVGKVENMEASTKSEIEELRRQVEELTRAKREEDESAKNQINDLKEQHSKEIEELKKKHAEELRKADESNEKKIQAIYSTIAEALGDSYTEEEASKTM